MAISSFSKLGIEPRAADLARMLQVSRAAVSLQLKTLIKQKLIEVGVADHRVRLTRVGSDLVVRISGKREAVQIFLNEILGVSRDVAEVDGCKVEHLISEETGAALMRLINFMKTDRVVVKNFLKEFKRTSKR